jgi:phytoene dehydrogenase-like protein
VPQPDGRSRFDAIVVGGGHNGLVAATLLGKAGLSVLLLERGERVGGAAVSDALFGGRDARLSRYSYLVSLFPTALLGQLGINVELRRRAIASYTPDGDTGLLVAERARTRRSINALSGDPAAFDDWQRFHAIIGRLAERVFPTLIEPLRSRGQLRRLIDDEELWTAVFERPLSELLERSFRSDLVRGLVLTDAAIGTFAPADDPELRQNRCFLYHVIGNGTGRWDVPVGGMGALTQALERAARRASAEIRTSAEVTGIETDGVDAVVTCADGGRHVGAHVLANVAPAVLSALLGGPEESGAPEGSQLKVNMLLSRLPRLRDPAVSPEEAFAGTLHVNEGYEQLQRAYEDASGGRIPARPPCELYCHSLTDPSILSSELQAAGAHTLTLFGLHMPARLFARDPERAKRAAVAATIASVDSVLAEPLSDCLARDAEGAPCLEALTPPELESELRMPGGHIFHRDLAWPFAESEHDVGKWGVETGYPNLWLCGAGARRGGGVSGIPGHNAAQALIAALSGWRSSPS